jgi:hypothetical protein
MNWNELTKQLVDQPLHLAWGIVTGLLFGFTALGPLFAGFSLGIMTWREWDQWPSKRWWDPFCDWTFLAIGVGVGLWLG